MGKMRRAYRAEKRDVGREKRLDVQTETGGVPAPPFDANLTPSSQAIAAERVENFHEVMKLLPDDYARVIRLRSIEQLSFNDIAEQMNRSHDSVTKLWYRAVLKFEELLNDSSFNSRG